MKFNYPAFFRLTLLCIFTSVMMVHVGVPADLRFIVSFLIGFLYPENLFLVKDESK